VDIILGKARRRCSDEEKRALVVETFRPGGSVSGGGPTPRGQLQHALHLAQAVSRRVGISGEAWLRWICRGRDSGPQFRRAGGDPLAHERSTDQRRVRLRRAYDGDRRGRSDACSRGGEGADAAMIPVPSGVRVWIATGHTDMRRGMNSLALQIQQALNRDPHAGDLFVFRGKRGNLVKIFWADGLGTSLYAKRLEKGRFVWPSPADGVVVITPAQLGYMLEGSDWRHPQHTWRPQSAG
jgi:transposase